MADAEMQELLNKLETVLDTLKQCGDLEGLLSKVGLSGSRKLLKKLKNVSSEVQSKANTIREGVSKVYKRSKNLDNTSSESAQNSILVEAPSDIACKDTENSSSLSGNNGENIGNSLERSDDEKDGAVQSIGNVQDVLEDVIEATPEKPSRIKICLSVKRSKEGHEDNVSVVNTTIEDSIVDDITEVSKSNESAEKNAKKIEGEREKYAKGSNSEEKLECKQETAEKQGSEIEITGENKENIQDKPVIKLVDINKLIAPNSKTFEITPVKNRKSVTFDSSIIVLTSSDDETPKKDPKTNGLSDLKGVLRKSSLKSTEDLEKSKKTEQKEDTSSSETDEDRSKRSSRRKKAIKGTKVRFSRLVEERSIRQLRARNQKSSKNASDKEKLNNHCIRKKPKKKELLEESELSDDSSSGESLKELPIRMKHSQKQKPKQNHAEPDINDPLLKQKVYIPLPKFKCEDLPDLYKNKRELLEIKKLARLNFDRPRKGQLQADEKSQESVKKIKQTHDKEKENSEEAESVPDDSEISESKAIEMSDLSVVIVPDVGGVGDSELTKVAEACLDEIKDSSDTEVEKENSPEKEISKSSNEKDVSVITNQRSDDNAVEQSEVKDNEKKTDEVVSNFEPAEAPTLLLSSDSDKEEKGSQKRKKTLTSASSDDSDDCFAKFSKKKDKSKEELVKEVKTKTKKKKKKMLMSDSDDDADSGPEGKKSSSSDSGASEKDKSSEDDDSEKEDKEKSKPARKRIKRVRESSSSDDGDKTTRKHIRRLIDRDSLSETTKKAEEQEKQRKARILEKQKKYNQIFEMKADATVDKVVLDFDEKTNEPLLSVHKKLVKQLKPHQVQGLKFMWDASFESLSRARKKEGSGCILAHCMGLGKTLQVIALVHTLLKNSAKTKVEKVMVVCPVNTVLNWKSEFKKWLPKSDDLDVYELVTCKTSAINQERRYIVDRWHEDGGVLIIGYHMFRNLSNPDNKGISKKLRESFQKGLVDPGADLVVCDEGHLLKNEKSNLTIAMNRIKTARRIVLTGTPLQNNLREYWCMVQFIKPNLLGTYKEYLNRFVNPITNGQYTDSTQHDIMIMRRRSHVLHKLLDGVVQRQDYDVLAPYLPPKYEYVIFLKLTKVQANLYKHYMENFARRGDGSNRTSFLFVDFQELQRICTHPRVLLDKSVEVKEKAAWLDDSDSEGSLKNFIDDGSESDSASSSSRSGGSSSDQDSNASIKSDEEQKTKKKQSGSRKAKKSRLTRAQAAQKRENGEMSENEKEDEPNKQWWDQYIDRKELDNINHSSKIFLLFQILKECEEIGDKVLVFSQSLYTLNCIEYFLARIDEATREGDTAKVGGHSGCWLLGLDYFRLDGSSSCDNRASWCDEFNDPENTRARLFLISTKAGGLGINLVAANRVIIFDVSWNPSHDIQSIYRVYRFGQTKPSYIYRFVTYGTMEMKIYERQVTKQAISKRVIDEQQIDRHYSQNDIQELYKTDLEPADRPIPLVPKDVLLGEMLQKYVETIFKYHEHQSLLENKQDEELNEEERKAAWEEFENEKVIRKTNVTNVGGLHLGAFDSAMNFSPQMLQLALGNIVRKDNPTWSDVQVKGILPALVTQLQMQVSEGDFTTYNRVQQEIRWMQAMHAQRMRQQLMNQYMAHKQQLANQMLGNMSVTPEELQRLIGQQAGGSDEVIDLND